MQGTFRYKVAGDAAEGQTWKVEGSVTASKNAHTTRIVNQIMHEVFFELTKGNAVFGHPGQGCCGPYKLTSFHMEVVDGP